MPRRKQAPRLYLDRKRRQWVIRDGARFIRTGCAESDTKQAEIQLATYLGQKYKPEGGPDPLIADVLLVYSQEHVPQTKAKSNAAYQIASLAKWWGERRISDITSASCHDYGRDRPASTARRDLETLRAAIGYYNRESGPLQRIPRIVVPAKSPPRERWLTRDEAKRLRRAAMKWPRLYRFVVIGLLTGTRSSPIMRMQWSWVDLDGRLMHRRPFGEAEDSRKKTPPVRISGRLARIMRRWKRDGCQYVIHHNGQPMKTIKRLWGDAVREAGLKGVTPHTLRHTRATWLMQAGIDPWEAAGSLGMSLEMLSRVYGKHHPNFQKRAAEV